MAVVDHPDYIYLEGVAKNFDPQDEDDERFIKALTWALKTLNPKRPNAPKPAYFDQLRRRETARPTTTTRKAVPRLRLAAAHGKIIE